MAQNHIKGVDYLGERKSDVRTLYLSDNSNEKTFQYDESLPALPVPELHHTIHKYLKSVEPFVSPEQFAITKNLAKKFEQGIGKDLQEKLRARASQQKNWLADWWLKYAYLTMRDPIAPTINMAGPQSLHLTMWKPNKDTILRETAMFMWSVLDFFFYLHHQKLRPHSTKNGEHLTMHQFRNLFNTVRIPGEGQDEVKSYFKTSTEGHCPNHLIVICYGHIWVMHPWHSINESLSISELEEQFKYIKRISEALGEGPGVGILTFDNREMWAKNRKWLSSLCKKNAENLHIIDTAISVISLDENTPQNISEVSKFTLCGEPRDRWADKSNTTVTYANGYHATTNDHSPFDAMVVVALGHYQHGIITDELMKLPLSPSEQTRKVKMPHRLVFQLDNLLHDSIQRIKSFNKSLRDNIDVNFMEFNIFGKNWMREHNIPPDAFIQCSLQLAYYQLHKRIVPTYETATTRRFYHGRTETVRSCSQEMVDFVKAMVSTEASSNEKRAKLQRALKGHVELMKECQNGQGIDRHLLGLMLIATESGLPLPELFTDPSFSLSGGNGNFVLSTSTLGYTHVLGGVAPMVKDGYGAFYVMLPDRFYFYLTNFVNGETSLEEYSKCLSRSLIYMYEIVSELSSRL